MSKYTFKPNQRYAVFKVFNGRCQWCKEPVDFKSFHVDHILPEELLNDPDKLKSVLSTYSVDAKFQINGYENWVPSHGFCNQYKSDTIYSGLGIIQTMLDASKNKKESAQYIELKLDREPNKALLITQIQAAIEINLLSISELTSSVLDQKFMEANEDDLKEIIETLNKKSDYQAAIMVEGIVKLLKEHTSQIVSELRKQLGADWNGSQAYAYGYDDDDGHHHFSYPILNDANKKMSLRIVTIPHFDNKTIKIVFKDSTYEEVGTYVLGSIEQDVNKIDWIAIRAKIREVYVNRLRQKAGI